MIFIRVFLVITREDLHWHEKIWGKGINSPPWKRLPFILYKNAANANASYLFKDNILKNWLWCKVGHGPYRPLPKGRNSASFVIIAIDYFKNGLKPNFWSKSQKQTLSNFCGRTLYASLEFSIQLSQITRNILITKRSRTYARRWKLRSISLRCIISKLIGKSRLWTKLSSIF